MTQPRAHTGATIHRIDEGLPVALITPALRESPPSIEAVERRRAHLWTVAALLLLTCSTVILLLFLEGDVEGLLPEIPAVRWSFLALSIAFILYVVDQERRLRRLSQALVEERVLTTALRARVTDLATLTKVGRVVNSVLSPTEVLETILSAVFELTEASAGSVMLLDGDELEVAASAGDSAAPRGSRAKLGQGVAGWVAAQREPLLIVGRIASDQFPGHVERTVGDEPGSSVIAPLVVGDEVLGVLTVERPLRSDPFGDPELRSVAVFAEHAATAVHNAQRYERERAAAARLADAFEQRTDFVARMVHELRTPLTVILGFASLLAHRWDEIDEERRAQMLDSVDTQGERLQMMITEILRTASDVAPGTPAHEPVDLAEVVAEVVERVRVDAEEREGTARSIRMLGDEPVWVLGDADALERVVENLLDNAVRFSPEGTEVDVVLFADRGEARVDVVDRGAGIPDDELESIFESFRRPEVSSIAGPGLGLYITRALVQSHGGRVWAVSNEHGGATFSVALPLSDEGGTGAHGLAAGSAG
jgi:signal transduction histidine kinase